MRSNERFFYAGDNCVAGLHRAPEKMRGTKKYEVYFLVPHREYCCSLTYLSHHTGVTRVW